MKQVPSVREDALVITLPSEMKPTLAALLITAVCGGESKPSHLGLGLWRFTMPLPDVLSRPPRGQVEAAKYAGPLCIATYIIINDSALHLVCYERGLCCNVPSVPIYSTNTAIHQNNNDVVDKVF